MWEVESWKEMNQRQDVLNWNGMKHSNTLSNNKMLFTFVVDERIVITAPLCTDRLMNMPSRDSCISCQPFLHDFFFPRVEINSHCDDYTQCLVFVELKIHLNISMKITRRNSLIYFRLHTQKTTSVAVASFSMGVLKEKYIHSSSLGHWFDFALKKVK